MQVARSARSRRAAVGRGLERAPALRRFAGIRGSLSPASPCSRLSVGLLRRSRSSRRSARLRGRARETRRPRSRSGRALRRAGHRRRRWPSSAGASRSPHRGRDRRAASPRGRADVRGPSRPAARLASCKELERRKGAGPETVPTVQSHACAAIAYLGWQRATESLTESSAALATDPTSYDAKVGAGAAPTSSSSSPPRPRRRFARADRACAATAKTPTSGWVASSARRGRRTRGSPSCEARSRSTRATPTRSTSSATRCGPRAESAGFFERATRERPSFTDAWLALGRQELAAGKVADASAAADAAVRSDPGSVAALVLSGKVALASKRPDDALKAGQAALKIVPNNAAAVLLDGRQPRDEGRGRSRRVEAYQTAWGLDHKDPTPLVHASQACHAASRDTSARAFGAKAAQEFPNWAPGWVALGDALVGQKEAEGRARRLPQGPGRADGAHRSRRRGAEARGPSVGTRGSQPSWIRTTISCRRVLGGRAPGDRARAAHGRRPRVGQQRSAQGPLAAHRQGLGARRHGQPRGRQVDPLRPAHRGVPRARAPRRRRRGRPVEPVHGRRHPRRPHPHVASRDRRRRVHPVARDARAPRRPDAQRPRRGARPRRGRVRPASSSRRWASGKTSSRSRTPRTRRWW